jgi:hypothetical protein
MIGTMDMVESSISEDRRKIALKLAAVHEPKYNRQTIRENNIGRYVGFLGETTVMGYLNRCSIHSDWQNVAKSDPNYNFDVDIKGIHLEIKSKDRKVFPRLNYECSVADYSKVQKFDYYIFTSLARDANTVVDHHTSHILGYITKEEYMDKARFLKKGEIDGSNGWVVSKDCWNLYISDLYPIHELVELLRNR